MDEADNNVDAVVCAYSGVPKLSLNGQPLPGRAAEKAGVEINIISVVSKFEGLGIPDYLKRY